MKSYCWSQFVQLRGGEGDQPEQLWYDPPPLRRRRQSKADTVHWQLSSQPKLLTSAKKSLQKKRQHEQEQQMSDLLSNKSSNYFLSRENTPLNPIINKKRGNNKINSLSSELFEIESKGSVKEEEDMFEELVMEECWIGLSELVYLEAMGREKKVSQKLLNSWKDCLLHEDKSEIYGEAAMYSHARIYPINELEKGFREIYGEGKKRALTVGEESVLLYEMGKYLEKCDKQPRKMGRKYYDIMNEILLNSRLTELEHYPVCLKQVELLWKVMATRWRYSGSLNLKDKQVETALLIGRSNFFEITKQTPLINFLLSHSNYKEIINK